MNLPPIDLVLSKLDKVQRTGSGRSNWRACCPVPSHEDTEPSLSITQCDDGRVLVHCHKGCTFDEICKATGLTSDDLKPLRSTPGTGRTKNVSATYDYHDEQKNLLYQVVRFESKGFRQRRPDGKGGWFWKLEGVRRVLYRLPELLAADPDEWVFVVEGEKDVETLRTHGLNATCNAGGAGKWKAFYDEPLRGRNVVILPDNDGPGHKHAADVFRSIESVAASARIIHLPGLEDKGDASDWFATGGTASELIALVDDSVEHQSEATPEPALEPAVNVLSEEVLEPERTWQPLPVQQVFPKQIDHFVTAVSESIGCDPSLVALPLLSGLASAIGTTTCVKLKPGWREPSGIWTLMICASGAGKSPASELSWGPIKNRQSKAFADHQKLMEEYETLLAAYNADVQNWKSKGRGDGKPQPTPPEAPVCERFVVSDVTIEALADRLQHAPRGLLVACDELSGWFQSFDQYRSGRGGDVAHWLTMHAGRDLLVDRKTGDKPTIFVPRASVCVTGPIQPDPLRKALGHEHFWNGMFARFLPCMPPRRQKRWSKKGIDPQLENMLATVFDRLWELEPVYDDQGKPFPRDLLLTRDAELVWENFYNEHNREAVDLPTDLAAAWSKLEGYAARLSLVIHCVRWAVGEPIKNFNTIDVESLEAGIILTRWFAQETRRVHSVLKESSEERNRRKLLELISRKGGALTARDIQRSAPKSYPNAESAERALCQLVNSNRGHWVDKPTSSKGGQPTRIFQLGDRIIDRTYVKPAEDGGSVNNAPLW